MMNSIVAGAVIFAVLAGPVVLEKGIASAADQSGEALFKQHCASCHANGSNIINPKKALDKKSREVNNIKTADDIVKAMRDPGPGMPKFDGRAVPDKDARQIADYIIKTFQ